MEKKAVVYLEEEGVLKIEDKRNEEQEKLNKLIGKEYNVMDFGYNFVQNSAYNPGNDTMYLIGDELFYLNENDEFTLNLIKIIFNENGYNFERFKKAFKESEHNDLYEFCDDLWKAKGDPTKQLTYSKTNEYIESIRECAKEMSKEEISTACDITVGFNKNIDDILFKENKIMLTFTNLDSYNKVFSLSATVGDEDFIDCYNTIVDDDIGFNNSASEKFGFAYCDNKDRQDDFYKKCKERFNKTMKQVLPKIFQIEGLD